MEKELIVALVGGIGTDSHKVSFALKREFARQGCKVVEIRISKLIDKFALSGKKNKTQCEVERIKHYMAECSNLRKKTKRKDIMASLCIAEICKKREKLKKQNTLYILNSIKRLEEYKLLRKIYGRNCILISISTPMEEREKNIQNKSESLQNSNEIQELIEKDYIENDQKILDYGQAVSETFPLAHLFVNTEQNLDKDIERFVDILFGHPFHTPTMDERNMFVATSMMYRSSDLSRQVGAIITDYEGDIIATGCNEVPKFGGGFYEPQDPKDARDFKAKSKKDSNAEEKLELIRDSLTKLKKLKYPIFKENEPEEFIKNLETHYSTLDKIDMQLTGLQEYGRPVHAETAAICDAARRGISLKDKIMYCTTYPCHICAKHILNVGIKRVVYIDPYPKSKARKLFEEAITHNPADKEKLLFEPFAGIAPKRYMFLFRMKKRKKNKLDIKPEFRTKDFTYLEGRNLVDYFLREQCILKVVKEVLEKNKFKNEITKIYAKDLVDLKEGLLKESIDNYCNEIRKIERI